MELLEIRIMFELDLFRFGDNFDSSLILSNARTIAEVLEYSIIFRPASLALFVVSRWSFMNLLHYIGLLFFFLFISFLFTVTAKN